MVLAASGLLAGAGPETEPRRHALLVGCGYYENLEEEWWLEGPVNDVALLRELLTGPGFEFDPESVVALAGWPAEEARRPTRANIVRELRRLATTVGAGDSVVVFLAGHGSQQPADADPADPEPDGLDEIFLPADVGEWDGELGRVENAISDDEIGELLAAAQDRGAFVWLIVDTCHSGTMMRGAPSSSQRLRRIPAGRLVPAEALRQASRVRTRGGVGPTPSPFLEPARHRGRLVATYASQPGEVTPEMPLPENGRFHGLFSYNLARVLREAASVLTYRELVERIAGRYRSLGHFYPTPFVEGEALDREILGLAEWPDRPRLLLGPALEGGGFRLHAGDLHGLRPGSVLEVYPPAGAADADTKIGHVRITRLGAASSVIEPVAWDGVEAPGAERLVEGSRCAVVWIDFGELRTRVALQSQIGDGTVVTYPAGAGPPDLERALSSLGAEAAALVERVAEAEAADWLVRTRGGQVLLVPAAGWAGDGESVPPRFALAAGDPAALAAELRQALVRIARARHLLRLADEGGGAADPELHVAVEIEIVEGGDGRPVAFGPQGRRLRPGDEVRFTVANRGAVAADVTLLHVDSSYGIQSIFPPRRGSRDNRVPPGRSLVAARGRINDDTVGPEQLVAIAVRSGDRRVDLSSLEQPGLTPAATRGGGEPSPLELLLDRALNGRGTLRGFESSGLDDYTVRLLTWTVLPR